MTESQLALLHHTLRHESTGRFLAYAQFSPALDAALRGRLGLGSEVDLTRHFGMYRPEHVSLQVTAAYQAPDFSRYFPKEKIPAGAFVNGIGVLEIPGSSYHFTAYVSPLRNAETWGEIEDYPYPSLDGISFDGMAAQVAAVHAEGRAATLWIGHMYETAWQIRGYERFLEDMLLEPERCEYILDRLMERNVVLAKAAAAAGCDYIMVGDDVANQRSLMFSIDLWRHFMKSRWEKVFQAARSVRPEIGIWYHSDGAILDIVPELLDIGVTILNPVQPECVDPVEIKRLLGRRAAIDGAIGTQTTMPFGTPADVKAMVRERVDTLGRDGALILSPTHMLEPEVPVENVLAFFEAVDEINAG